MTDPNVATVRLIDRKTRVVELLGPLPPGGRRPELLYEDSASRAVHLQRPPRVGFCIGVDDRRAKFIVDKGNAGDELLDLLARHPEAPARLARPYGPTGVLVES